MSFIGSTGRTGGIPSRLFSGGLVGGRWPASLAGGSASSTATRRLTRLGSIRSTAACGSGSPPLVAVWQLTCWSTVQARLNSCSAAAERRRAGCRQGRACNVDASLGLSYAVQRADGVQRPPPWSRAYRQMRCRPYRSAVAARREFRYDKSSVLSIFGSGSAIRNRLTAGRSLRRSRRSVAGVRGTDARRGAPRSARPPRRPLLATEIRCSGFARRARSRSGEDGGQFCSDPARVGARPVGERGRLGWRLALRGLVSKRVDATFRAPNVGASANRR
jgi:hypothetical protein